MNHASACYAMVCALAHMTRLMHHAVIVCHNMLLSCSWYAAIECSAQLTDVIAIHELILQ